jgi:hypothetical protein
MRQSTRCAGDACMESKRYRHLPSFILRKLHPSNTRPDLHFGQAVGTVLDPLTLIDLHCTLHPQAVRDVLPRRVAEAVREEAPGAVRDQVRGPVCVTGAGMGNSGRHSMFVDSTRH